MEHNAKESSTFQKNQTTPILHTSPPSSIHHIYDKIIKKILTLSSQSVINLINALFHTSYPSDSIITYNWTEHHDDDLKRTIADTILTINHSHSYHIEAQMYRDDDIEFRVFDYGYHHALTAGTDQNTLTFPEPQILYLYHSGKLPDHKSIILDFGTQGTFTYTIPVFKLMEHSSEELSRRKMIILVPFMLLKLRDSIRKERTPENMEALRSLILNDIITLIVENQKNGNITASDANRLRSLIRQLYNHLYSHYQEFIEGGLNDMMEDGLVLEYDIIEAEMERRLTERITKEVTDKVTAEVTDKLKRESQIHFVRSIYAKLHDVQKVADLLDLSPAVVSEFLKDS